MKNKKKDLLKMEVDLGRSGHVVVLRSLSGLQNFLSSSEGAA